MRPFLISIKGLVATVKAFVDDKLQILNDQFSTIVALKPTEDAQQITLGDPYGWIRFVPGAAYSPAVFD